MAPQDDTQRCFLRSRPGSAGEVRIFRAASPSSLTKSLTTEGAEITEGIPDAHLCELCVLCGEAGLVFWSRDSGACADHQWDRVRLSLGGPRARMAVRRPVVGRAFRSLCRERPAPAPPGARRPLHIPILLV